MTGETGQCVHILHISDCTVAYEKKNKLQMLQRKYFTCHRRKYNYSKSWISFDNWFLKNTLDKETVVTEVLNPILN
jgi:hypothetical protein